MCITNTNSNSNTTVGPQLSAVFEAKIWYARLIQSDLYYPRLLRPKFGTPNLYEVQ